MQNQQLIAFNNTSPEPIFHFDIIENESKKVFSSNLTALMVHYKFIEMNVNRERFQVQNITDIYREKFTYSRFSERFPLK